MSSSKVYICIQRHNILHGFVYIWDDGKFYQIYITSYTGVISGINAFKDIMYE